MKIENKKKSQQVSLMHWIALKSSIRKAIKALVNENKKWYILFTETLP